MITITTTYITVFLPQALLEIFKQKSTNTWYGLSIKTVLQISNKLPLKQQACASRLRKQFEKTKPIIKVNSQVF